MPKGRLASDSDGKRRDPILDFIMRNKFSGAMGRGIEAQNQVTDSIGGTTQDVSGAAWGSMNNLQRASLASSAMPIVPDVLGVLGDAQMYYEKPEERNWLNYAGTAAGALPFVPSTTAIRSGIANSRRTHTVDDFDPRFGNLQSSSGVRKKEQPKIQNMKYETDLPEDAPWEDLSVYDLEGKPFILTMSDRTAAGGNLYSINGKEFYEPTRLLGGQDYMFHNDGLAWASGSPLDTIAGMAEVMKRETGQEALLLPWRMGATAGDFSHMTGETMLRYANAAITNNKVATKVDNRIKHLIPNWKGIKDPASIEQFMQQPATVRMQIQKAIDKDLRDERGILAQGMARMATTDPAQRTAKSGYLQNVAQIDSSRGILDAGGNHPSYPHGLAGEGLGVLKEDVSGFHLLDPDIIYGRQLNADGSVKRAGRTIDDPSNPSQDFLYSLQLKPQAGIITEETLRRYEDAMKALSN